MADLTPMDIAVRERAIEGLQDILLQVRAGARPEAYVGILGAMAAFCFGSACAAAFNASMAKGQPTSPVQEAEALAKICVDQLRKKFGN